jgi:D-lactate dehydrogenase (cytochrome)
MPRFGIDLQLKHGMLAADPSPFVSPWYALVEISRMKGTAPGTIEDALEAAIGNSIVTNAAIAQSEAQRETLWAAREQMSEVQSKEGASIKHDISVPIAAIPRMIAEGTAAAERMLPGIRACPFGHMGDGNLHFNFSQPVGMDGKAFMAQEKTVNAAVYEVVLKLHGSISAEHGIGQLKSDLLKQVKDPVALEMMRSIKAALDPNGILNPGKLLG